MPNVLDQIGQGMTDEQKVAILAQIGEIRGQVNETFGKSGNTTTAGITTDTGLVSLPLERPAKALYSVWTRLRERIARESSSQGGEGITWRAIVSIFGGGYDAGIAEAATGSTVRFTEENHTADYKTLGRLSNATFEAISAGQSFEDVVALATLAGLQNTQVSEEISILGGCTTGIAKPGAITAASTNGGTLANTTTYDYGVSAVTLLGTDWVNGTGARGHAAGADSANETDASTDDHATGGAGTALQLSWASVPGAFAYNVYAAAHGDPLKFVTQVTVPSYKLTAIPVAGNAPNGANLSANALQFDGIGVQAPLAGGDTFIDLAGAGLTSGVGSVVEIDNALEVLFRTLKLPPTLLVVSGHEAVTIRNKILGNGVAVSNQRFNVDVAAGGAIRGGSIFMEYTNPFFPGSPIEVLAHPFLPQGTAFLITEKLPPWYPKPEISTTWAIDARREYYSVEYAISTASGRSKPIGVYVEEVLKGYLPGGTVTLAGIGA